MYFIFKSSETMNETSVSINYFKAVSDKIGEEKAVKFVEENPLVFNGKLNRYQNFPL